MMKFRWFNDCRTAEEGKKRYHELAKKFHTDNGGNEETMKEINSEFSTWWKEHKDIHFSEEKKETYTSEKKTSETAEQFINIVSALFNLGSAIEIEIRGRWLWISGNTYPVRYELAKLGCRWSKSKKSWYWTTDPYQVFKKTLSVAEQRMKYGSEWLDGESFKRVSIGGA